MEGKSWISFFFLIFFNVYLLLRQRETEHEWGTVRERETQNLKQAPGSELSAQSPTGGSNSRTAGLELTDSRIHGFTDPSGLELTEREIIT